MPSLEDVPTWLATTWDITVLSAQVILSIIVILAVLLPVLIATKGRGPLIPIIAFILVEAFLVSIEWLDAWLMIFTVLIVGLMFARTGSELVSGG